MQENNEHSYFINQLYRDFLLPTILGEDTKEILYWAGKKIANKYALSDTESLIDFFQMAQFGDLKLITEKRVGGTFELSGQVVEDRLNSDNKDFELEAGIISACLASANQRDCESSVVINDKENKVQIIAQY